MSDTFLLLSQEKQREILEGAESQLGIRPYLLEKDIWICWILSELFALPKKMAFKGGTSLSKCYGLIDRFSEDVDVTIDYREFMPDLDISKESKNSLKNKREKLKQDVEAYITSTVIPGLESAYAAQFAEKKFDYEFIEGEKLYFKYPSVFAAGSANYVADSVLIEFGGSNKAEPNEIKEILPYLALEGMLMPEANVAVLSPRRTFWEKVTLIHVECHRKRLAGAPDRMSRHWYDLAKLSESDVKLAAINDQSIMKDVLEVKKAFFNASYANYEKCEMKQFRLIPDEDEIASLKSDYLKMRESDMFLGEQIPFERVLLILNSLEKEINRI